MRILYIAYFYPPIGGAGTQRSAIMVRELRALGHEVTILTSSLSDLAAFPDDKTIRENSDQGISIRRGGEGGIVSWVNWLDVEALPSLRDDEFDVIVLTMSPFEPALMVMKAARRIGALFVADLRDPWALDGWREYPSKKSWEADLGRMESCLSGADMVVMNTPESLIALKELRVDIPDDRLAVVTNGFSEEDFEGKSDDDRDQGSFRIRHTGTLHWAVARAERGLRGKARRLFRYRPEPILPGGRTDRFISEAIRKLVDSDAIPEHEIRLEFFGIGSNALSPEGRELRTRGILETSGYIPHSRSVAALCGADLLFLPLHGLPPGRRSRIIPGKTYEYLRSGRPILGALPAGDCREIVERLASDAHVVDPQDVKGMMQAILFEFERFKANGRIPDEDRPGLDRFERSELASEFAAHLDKIVDRRSGNNAK